MTLDWQHLFHWCWERPWVAAQKEVKDGAGPLVMSTSLTYFFWFLHSCSFGSMHVVYSHHYAGFMEIFKEKKEWKSDTNKAKCKWRLLPRAGFWAKTNVIAFHQICFVFPPPWLSSFCPLPSLNNISIMLAAGREGIEPRILMLMAKGS